MNARYQVKTLVRLVAVVIVAGVTSTILTGPRADAASDGYGYGVSTVANVDVWHDASLIEGRSAVLASNLR